MNGLDPILSIRYMVAGYAVFFIVMAAYLASLVIRWSNLKRALHSLEKGREKE